MVKENWLVQAKRADFNALGEMFQIHPVTARVIRNRDHKTKEEIDLYLNGDISQLNSPFLMKDMEQGVELLHEAIVHGKRIRVIGDYDIDGVCAGYILTDGIRKLGGAVDFDVPDRIADGYGLNERIVKKCYDDQVELIVTCDNGIAAREPIAYAKQLGMQVIVTDHHDVPFEESEGVRTDLLPKADVVINPKQAACGYPFKELCGAAVALKLILAYAEHFGKQSGQDLFLSEDLEQYYVFAAIATVGDVVNLVEENRILVKYGLRRIKTVQNYGLQALIQATGCEERKITSYHIGFVIGPCINAGGRLETAKLAFELFSCTSMDAAMEKAENLKEINDRRKDMTVSYTNLAIQMIEADSSYQKDKVLIVYMEDCHESLAGIIAGRLREAFYKPTIVLTKSAEGAKGSGRSIEGYHMFENLVALDHQYHYLTKYGGHSMAAGLSLPLENIEKFRIAINALCTLTEEDLIRKVWIDVALPFGFIRPEFVSELELLEPFGKGNEKPVFADKVAKILKIQVRGKNRNVLSMQLQNQDGARMEAVLFEEEVVFREHLLQHYTEAEVNGLFQGYFHDIHMLLIYYPEIQEYRGVESLKIVIKKYQVQ